MAAQRWIVYGLSGVVGVAVLAGAATLTATAMELRTDDGTVLEGGGVDAGRLGEKASPTTGSSRSNPSPSPSLTPSPTPVKGGDSAVLASAPSVPAPPPAPVTKPPQPVAPPVPVAPPAPVAVESAGSVDSVASAGSDD